MGEVKLKLKLWGFIPWSVKREVLRSVHGPALRTEHGVYAIRYSGIDEMKQVEQWLAMNKAKNFEEWACIDYPNNAKLIGMMLRILPSCVEFQAKKVEGRRLVPNIGTAAYLAVAIDLAAHQTLNALPLRSTANAVDRQNGGPDDIASVVGRSLALQSFFLGR